FGKIGSALLAQRGEALLHFGSAEADELQRQRGIEAGAGKPQPVVERVFGPADGGWRSGREPLGDAKRHLIGLAILGDTRDEANALRLLTRERLAEQQVVFRLGEAAEQRPDDHRVVASGNAKTRVTVDDARAPRRDGDVGEKPGNKSRADGRALDRRDDGLVAVDEVVDEVARFLPHAGARGEVAGDGLDHGEIAASREGVAGAAQQRHRDLAIGIDIAPDLGQLGMHRRVGGVELAGIVEDDLEHALRRAGEFEALIARIAVGHALTWSWQCLRWPVSPVSGGLEPRSSMVNTLLKSAANREGRSPPLNRGPAITGASIAPAGGARGGPWTRNPSASSECC